jgi:hypothetical protein
MLNDMWREIKRMMGSVTPIQAIAFELHEAEMALLLAETGVEYASSLVTYNRNRVKRLKAYMATEGAKD